MMSLPGVAAENVNRGPKRKHSNDNFHFVSASLTILGDYNYACINMIIFLCGRSR